MHNIESEVVANGDLVVFDKQNHQAWIQAQNAVNVEDYD